MDGLSEEDEAEAMELTEKDNVILDMFKGNTRATTDEIRFAVENSGLYEDEGDGEDEAIDTATERIEGKLKIINSEYLKWFEVLLGFVFALIAYMAPIWILIFQVKMRQLEMEDEVMQFQTIIMMLMKIERVNVEMILEWLEKIICISFKPFNIIDLGKLIWTSLQWEAQQNISYFKKTKNPWNLKQSARWLIRRKRSCCGS